MLYRILRAIARPLFWFTHHTTACGRARALKAKPVILTGNHLSAFDVVSICTIHKRRIYTLGKKELSQGDFSRKMLDKLGLIPVDRGTADLDSMRKIMKLLKEGEDIAIYPEGTRNKADTRLCKIHGGAAMFAIKTKSAIAPFATDRKPRWFRRNFMIFGDPYELSDFYGSRVDAETLLRADDIVKEKLIEVKRLADYLSTLKGKPRRYLISLLNQPAIAFADIYGAYRDYLLPHEFSVAPDGFDQSGIAKEA